MATVRVRRAYGVAPRVVFAAVASGELFVACGASRHSVQVDFCPGGRFTTSVISGLYTRLAGDSVVLALDDGSEVALAVDGHGQASTLTVVHHDTDPALQHWWESGLTALYPAPGRADVSERRSYEDWLDFHRCVVPGKLHGVSESDARRSFVGSATTLLGLAKHLTGVERNWFAVVVGQRSRARVGPNNRGGDDSWRLGPDDTIESVLARYAAACAQSRRIAVRHELDEVFRRDNGDDVSLRTVYVHMIEETARHAGHADILRELLDGTTGVDPAGSG